VVDPAGVFHHRSLRSLKRSPNTYLPATVQLLIERQTPRYIDQPGTSGQQEYYGEEFYQTHYKLLESRALAKKVAEKLNLKNHPSFAPIFRSLHPNADDAMKQRAEEGLIGAIAGGVQVDPVRQSRLVNVSFSDPDPKFAATVSIPGPVLHRTFPGLAIRHLPGSRGLAEGKIDRGAQKTGGIGGQAQSI
jgi:hypothetical protein